MKKKANRLDAIKMIISSKDVSSQEELLQALSKEGFELTQATMMGIRRYVNWLLIALYMEIVAVLLGSMVIELAQEV